MKWWSTKSVFGCGVLEGARGGGGGGFKVCLPLVWEFLKMKGEFGEIFQNLPKIFFIPF